MRLLHYLEIRNFKRFGETRRIDLDHPAVLIGPNNSGKTTAIQAIALWSQAVKTWFDVKGEAPPKERTSTGLNRLNIISVPVQRTRYFWHNAAVRTGNRDIKLEITLGVLHENRVEPVTMQFRNQGSELVYCTPDEATLAKPELIRRAAAIDVELLYPMSGIETEEPLLQPGRIGVLLGQGQTAQVLRNLCLMVFRESPEDWKQITALMERLFRVKLADPEETARGAIDLFYRQAHVRERLDVALAGRGLQQMLLIFAYLYTHRGSVLLIDEPDAHLEILRQKQVYVLLREIAARNESQVVLVTHSDIILQEALDHNLTLLLEGQADDLAAKSEIRNALKHYGADHYVRARQRGYVLYVEGGTDLDNLRALAERLGHRAADAWDERINAFYVQDDDDVPEAYWMRTKCVQQVGFRVRPDTHFHVLQQFVPGLVGLAILENEGKLPKDASKDGLQITYWQRYEAENYIVTPEVLMDYVADHYRDMTRCGGYHKEAVEVLDELIQERVLTPIGVDSWAWQRLDAAGDLFWLGATAQVKLSDFAEEFFRRLAERLNHAMLLRKGELHRLLDFVDPAAIPDEVSRKLDLLAALFDSARPGEEPRGLPGD